MYRYISNVILICTQGANRIKPEWSEKKIRGHISFGKRGSGEVQCVALCDLPMFVSVFGGQRTVAPLWTSCRPDGESVRGAKKHKMFHLQMVSCFP